MSTDNDKNSVDQILGNGDECDGIEEYDNALPGWWIGLFILCVAFAVAYVPYLYATGWSSSGQYQAEVAAAQERWPAAAPIKAVSTPEAIAAGKEVYTATCIACHGPELKGGIGPDLTDATWIHGGALPEIANTVTVGVLDKGMPAWGPILGPEKVAAVAAFVHSAGGGK